MRRCGQATHRAATPGVVRRGGRGSVLTATVTATWANGAPSASGRVSRVDVSSCRRRCRSTPVVPLLRVVRLDQAAPTRSCLYRQVLSGRVEDLGQVPSPVVTDKVPGLPDNGTPVGALSWRTPRNTGVPVCLFLSPGRRYPRRVSLATVDQTIRASTRSTISARPWIRATENHRMEYARFDHQRLSSSNC